MNERQDKALAFIQRHGRITNRDYQDLCPEVSPETLRLVWRADPDYLAAALDGIDTRYGSIQGYLKGPLGLSDIEIASLKRRLLE